MIDGSHALQSAIVAALRADGGVTGLVGARIVDRPKPNETMPYISIGPSDTIPFHRMEQRGCTVTMQLDIWAASNNVGTKQMVSARQVAAAVTAALFGSRFTVAGWKIHQLWPVTSRVMADPDGVTSHGILTIQADMQPL